MEQQLVQQLKLTAAQILRQTKVSQCRGYLSSTDETGVRKFCALGAILNHLGWSGNGEEDIGEERYQELYKLIPKDMIQNITLINDEFNHTFNEVADFLDAYEHARKENKTFSYNMRYKIDTTVH
jgi:hypothetical protein